MNEQTTTSSQAAEIAAVRADESECWFCDGHNGTTPQRTIEGLHLVCAPCTEYLEGLGEILPL